MSALIVTPQRSEDGGGAPLRKAVLAVVGIEEPSSEAGSIGGENAAAHNEEKEHLRDHDCKLYHSVVVFFCLLKPRMRKKKE